MRWSWVFKMAWRDSRKSRSRLFLFISSIILGIASLVAMKSFNENLTRNIDEQAAQLLGADLELESRRAPNDEILHFIDSLKDLSDQFAMEEQFMSMVRFTKNDGSRLIQVRAIAGSYPFYGALETEPDGKKQVFGERPEALVDRSLMIQFDAQVGDSIQLGLNRFQIGAQLLLQPGQSSISGSLTPSIWVPHEFLANSGLQQTGSRIEYLYYFKFPQGYQVDELVDRLKGRLTALQLRSATVQTTKEETGRSFSDMANFMQLVGFVALLLGCIGVSSAVHIYVREKLVSVAILRCLGASAKQTFFIFFIQLTGIGVVGGVLGAALGTLTQYLVPLVLQNFVPVDLTNQLSWPVIAEGVALGVVVSILFALLPLISVRKISPLNSLRISSEADNAGQDPARWWIYLLIAAFVLVFSNFQLHDWSKSIIFSLGIGTVFLVFYGIAKVFSLTIRRFFPKKWAYLWKQGLANLYRPQNQTVVLLISIGMGTALVATMLFVQDMLLQRVQIAADDKQANMLLFDIQPSQLEPLRQMTLEQDLPVVEEVPIVTVQITSINGREVSDIIKDTTAQRSMRSLNREIRATFRDQMTASEKITAGNWVGQVRTGDTAQISLEVGYARRIGVEIGDRVEFNVHGVHIPAIVSSTREVDWNQFQTNFRLSFAKGSIDDAPRFYVLMTRMEDPEISAIFQQNVVKEFPNVSVIDINTVLQILTDLMQKISFVIQFVGGFSIITGIIVLIASVRISKYQRIKENVLLRTLGASRKQIFTINLSEYLILGFLAAAVGLIAALIISSLLSVFMFEMVFVPSVLTILILLVLVSLLTAVIGLLNTLGTLNRPPLEVLRKT